MYRHIVLLSLLIFFVTAGCVPTAELYIGKEITAAPIVRFEGGAEVSGTWQTFDMTINYQYKTDGASVVLAGQGQLGQHYQMVYDGVRRLSVYLFLLDADGLVKETINIPAYIYRTDDTFTFTKTLQNIAGVKGFSFGYRGVATEMEGQVYFDNLP